MAGCGYKSHPKNGGYMGQGCKGAALVAGVVGALAAGVVGALAAVAVEAVDLAAAEALAVGRAGVVG